MTERDPSEEPSSADHVDESGAVDPDDPIDTGSTVLTRDCARRVRYLAWRGWHVGGKKPLLPALAGLIVVLVVVVLVVVGGCRGLLARQSAVHPGQAASGVPVSPRSHGSPTGSHTGARAHAAASPHGGTRTPAAPGAFAYGLFGTTAAEADGAADGYAIPAGNARWSAPVPLSAVSDENTTEDLASAGLLVSAGVVVLTTPHAVTAVRADTGVTLWTYNAGQTLLAPPWVALPGTSNQNAQRASTDVWIGGALPFLDSSRATVFDCQAERPGRGFAPQSTQLVATTVTATSAYLVVKVAGAAVFQPQRGAGNTGATGITFTWTDDRVAVVALDLFTGALQWQMGLDVAGGWYPMPTTPLGVVSQTLVLPLAQVGVVGIAAMTGALVWQNTQPTVAGDNQVTLSAEAGATCYAVTTNQAMGANTLLALVAATGRLLWSQTITGKQPLPPDSATPPTVTSLTANATAQETVITVVTDAYAVADDLNQDETETTTLFAYDLPTAQSAATAGPTGALTLAWTHTQTALVSSDGTGDAFTAPVVLGGTLLIGDAKGRLVAFNAQTGVQRWARTPADAAAPTARSGAAQVVGWTTLTALDTQTVVGWGTDAWSRPALIAYAIATGQELWSRTLPAGAQIVVTPA